ncbi:unnamed protein product [Arctogadus glacialis]
MISDGGQGHISTCAAANERLRWSSPSQVENTCINLQSVTGRPYSISNSEVHSTLLDQP